MSPQPVGSCSPLCPPRRDASQGEGGGSQKTSGAIGKGTQGGAGILDRGRGVMSGFRMDVPTPVLLGRTCQEVGPGAGVGIFL